MSQSSINNILCLLTFTFLLHTSQGQSQPIFSTCVNDNFTQNGQYSTNLNNLMAYLYQQAPNTGFGLSSIGQTPDKVNGLALCTFNVSADDCRSCIASASSYIRQTGCPNGKRAMVWYDSCGLKYSDEEFFGRVDNKSMVTRYAGGAVSNGQVFVPKVKELLDRLADEASLRPEMYAAGELAVEDKTTVYGLAQCTRDLSLADCKTCLLEISKDLPNIREGGRAMCGSCNVKYDLSPSLAV